ncbi:MAG TPA: LysR substrate-binding domain-containing protein [Gaiellaceae bacterium]|nr:LysR substrate-binding domain-containing protein [Gaiellaceae bacterium]
MADISESFRWIGVELRHLVALRTVAEEGSLAGAARRLGYSQPAVSQQLQTLERLVGSRLVERRAGGREVTLSEAGQRVLLHGAAMLARAQAADAELRALEDGSAGSLRLGTIPSIGARIVPELLRRFGERAPAIEIELVEDAWDDRLLDQLEAGELELAFGFPPLRDGPFNSVELLEDPYVLLVAADSPLAAAKRTLSLRRLADIPLIVCSQSEAADAFCRAHGIAAQIRYRIDDNATLVGLAAAGLGAALLPRLAVDPSRTDVVQVELATKPPPRLIVLAWHGDREQTASARALVELAGEVCADLFVSTERVIH